MLTRLLPSGFGRWLPASQTILLLLVPAACSCNGDDDEVVYTPTEEPTISTEVAGVRLIPAVLHARLLDTVWVDAVPLDSESGHISGLDLNVTWDSPGNVWLEGGTEGALISVLDPAGVGTQAHWEVHGVKVTMGGVSAELALIASNADYSSPSEDWVGVSLPWPSGDLARRGRPVLTLIDAESDAGCELDEMHALGWGGFLGGDKKKGCGTDAAELALFSRKGGVKRLEDPAGPPDLFSPGSDHVQVDLGGPKVVNLVFWDWAFREGSTLRDRMEEDLQYAQAGLDQSQSGILLEAEFRTNPEVDRNRRFEFPGSECSGEAGDSLESHTSGEIEQVSDDKIHVIYVNELVDDYGWAGSGAFCFWEVDRLPAVLISASKTTPGSLAHELGHVFGLHVGAMADTGGHTTDLDGFDASNLMNRHSGYPTGNREVFTLGQVYRMHFDPRSWIHEPDPGLTVRCCQGSPYTNNPCPDLWTAAWEVGDPGLESKPYTDEVCSGSEEKP